jgi:aspartokinase-like uncharacterized kinase
MGMVVVKVGGSLFLRPGLAAWLRGYLARLAPEVPLVVPGGGLMADAVRAYARAHSLGDEEPHWLALRACEVNAWFLAGQLRMPVVAGPLDAPGVLAPHQFAMADEGKIGCLPHSWDATSDSVAARVAEVAGARLVLVKAVPRPPQATWEEAARAGLVDPVLPTIIARARLDVEVVAYPG